MTVAKSVARSVASPVARAVTAGIGGGQTLAQVVADAVGYWPLQDDAVSTVILNEAGGNGTLNGGNNTADLSTTGPGSNFTKALDLDGTADYIDAGSSPVVPATGNFTIALAQNLTSAVAEQVFFAQFISFVGNGRLLIRNDATNKLSAFLGNQDVGALGSVNIGSGQALTGWHHVSLVRDGNTFRFYVDNQLDDTHTDLSTRSILQTGVLLGARSGSATVYNASVVGLHNGPLGPVAVWDRALSDAERYAVYTGMMS